MASREPRWFRVATFCEPGETRRSKVNAYTLWFNPEWKNCAVFELRANSGKDAKRIAITHRLAFEVECIALDAAPATESGVEP